MKHSYIKSNQIKSNQIKSNQIKSNQIKLDLIQSNPIPSQLTEHSPFELSEEFNKLKISHKYSVC